MPIVLDSEYQGGMGTPAMQPETDPWKYSPTIGEVIGPAFRQGNPVGSMLDVLQSSRPDMASDATYRVLDDPQIKGTKFETDHIDKFLGSPNAAYTKWLRERIEREQKDRELLASSGGAGVAAMLGMGLVDPFNAIPVTAAVSKARTAANFARAGAMSAAGSEAFLQASQLTRTPGESLENIATSTIVMGLLGAAVGRFVTPREVQAISDDIADLRGVPRETPDVPAAGVAADLAPQPVGAAAADVRTLKPVSIGIDQLPALAERVRDVPYVGTFLHDAARVTSDLFTRTSPTMRTFFQDYSLTARKAMADMAETSLRFVDNTVGIPTTYHGAISRIVRNEQTRFQLKAQEIVDDLWKQHFYGENVPTAAVARSNLDRLLGNAPEGKLDMAAFKAEVSRAAWSGDTHAVPQVQQAAQMIRKEILEPIRKAMVESGLASEEMLKPRGDLSFFPRIWNKKVVAERRNELRTKIADWYEQEQTVKAAAKERLELLAQDHAGHVADIERLEAKLEAIQNKAANTNTRLSERGMEARATEKRADTLEGRLGEVQSQISELEEFIADLRRELPEARAQVSDLEIELGQLKREAAPLSKAEEARIAKADIERALPDADWREAAAQFLGRKKGEEENLPSLAGWIIREGGIKDYQGEVRSIVGRGTPSRLINNSGMTLEDLGMKLYEKAKWAFGGERPTVAEVLEVVRDAHNGVQPYWWREAILGQDGMDRVARVADRRDVLAEMADLTGREPKSMRDVSEMLLLGFNENPAVLDRLMEKARAGSEVVPAERALEIRRETLAGLREHLPKAIKERNALERQGVVLGAATREAGSAANRNRGRMQLLEDRADTQAKISAIYSDTIALLEKRRLEIRDKIESEIRDWKGNSSVEALAALEKRDEALAKRQDAMAAGEYKGRGERLRSADKAVDRAVRRIVDSERDMSRIDLESRANETIDRILGGPDGRLNYDVDSKGNPRMGPPSDDPPLRGSMHEREFAIPSDMIADFVERDTETVISSFLRTALPDIELSRRFGDVEMRDVFRSVNEDFSAKAAELGNNPKDLRRLEARRARTIEDLAAVRDKLRNVYGWSSSVGGQKAARFANSARAFNAMADLGSSTLNSMGDLAGTVFRYGLMGVYRDGWEPFFKGMLGMSDAGPALKRQMKAAGIAVETHLNLRHHQLSDITENWRPGNRFERALQWGAEKSQLLNLQAPYTDFAKTIAGSVAQAEILRAAERVALGKATQKEITQLAESSIDPAMAAKIWSEFQNGGGDVIDGVRLANSENWRDRSAARAFEHALSREADIAVVTPGMEKPLWMSTPVAGLLGQFKSFVAGTHERTLIAGLQRRDANTLQGLMAAVAMGMLSYRLYTLASGKEASDKPQEWIKEGISRSGVMGWFDEINSLTAKATGGKGDIFRLIGADKELSRYQSRSILSSLLGPTAGRIEGVAGITRAMATGEASAADIAQARRLVPLQNHFALRRLLNEVEDGVAHSLGIEPADRSPRQ